MPALLAVITPLLSTPAIFSFEVVKYTFLFVVVDGKISKLIFILSPTYIFFSLFKIFILCDLISLVVTLIDAVAFLLPSSEIAVTVAIPSFKPFTKPFEFTVKIVLSLLAHLIFLLVALDGEIILTKNNSSFTFIFRLLGLIVIDSTLITF